MEHAYSNQKNGGHEALCQAYRLKLPKLWGACMIQHHDVGRQNSKRGISPGRKGSAAGHGDGPNLQRLSIKPMTRHLEHVPKGSALSQAALWHVLKRDEGIERKGETIGP